MAGGRREVGQNPYLLQSTAGPDAMGASHSCVAGEHAPLEALLTQTGPMAPMHDAWIRRLGPAEQPSTQPAVHERDWDYRLGLSTVTVDS
jgi:hypothetical protein